MCRVFFGLLIVSVLGTLIPFQTTWATGPELQTSTVLLTIKSGDDILEKEPLFEILDFDKYVLVPLNGLSAYLPYNISFDREANSVTVEAQTTKRRAIVDLKYRKYVIEDELRWPVGEQPPLSLNGEFYVSTFLIEYLVDVKFEWSSKYQELTLLADWMEKKTETGATGERGDETESKTNYIEGPPFSIGSIRYKLTAETREGEDIKSSSKGSFELRGDGRAGAWAISLGGKVEYETDQDTKLIPTLIRAKYNENNQLIVIGDADVYFDKTLEQQRVRGILFMTPDNAFSRYLVPHTTISGPANPGDKVTLIVNGKEKGGVVVDKKSNSYCFANVPLSINRLNIIRVIVDKPSGEQLISEEKIAASLRILEDETHSIMVTAGKYKKSEDDENWIGEMVGYKTGQSLFNKISFDSEAVRIKLDDDSEGIADIGSDTGIAFRVGQNTVCTFDWLAGGEETDLKSGWESSLLYCLERGYIKGIVFYVDPAITSNNKVKTDPGDGIRILGEIELSDRTSLVGEFETIEALGKKEDFDDYQSLKDFDLKMVRKYGETLDNNYSVGVRKRIQEEEPDNLLYYENLNRIYFEQHHFTKNFSLNSYLDYDDFSFRDIIEGNIKSGIGNATTIEADYIHLITETILYCLSTEYNREWGERKNEQELYFETELQRVSPKMWLGGNYQVGYYAQESDPLEPASRKVEVWSKHFLNENLTLNLNLARILMDYDYYTSGEANLTYYLKNSKDKYYASMEYTSPYQTREQSQYAYKLGLIRNLKNGLEFKLEAERLYETIWAKNPEDVIRLSCAQAVGFGGGRLKTVKPDSNNLSFISGLVYLDENGNHQYDQGEKLLPDIKMSLNGRVAVSDEKGEYIYNYVQAGTYQLNFALKSLTADYTPATEPKLLKIKENENMFFDFGLTMNGSVSGKVYLDTNSNGVLDQGDKPLNWVELFLDNGKKKVFAGNDGTFYFENVPLGEHTLTVMEESIPKEMMLAGEKSFTFILKEDSLDVSDILISVVYKFK